MTEHPITPPLELMQQWAAEWHEGSCTQELLEHIATQAARWGANQELEACCEWADFHCSKDLALDLRDARRPTPPSLKEQAQRILIENGTTLDGRLELDPDDINIIRRALEALPDD